MTKKDHQLIYYHAFKLTGSSVVILFPMHDNGEIFYLDVDLNVGRKIKNVNSP